MNLDFFDKNNRDFSISDELQDLTNQLKEFLENITEKISDGLLNRDYENAEKILQEYFNDEGKRRYTELVEGNVNGNAYYVLVTENKDEKVFYGSNTTEGISNPYKIDCLNNIEHPVAFRIENGKIKVDRELSKQYEKMQNDIEKGRSNVNDVTLLEKIKEENKTSLNSSIKMNKAKNEIIKTYVKDILNKGELYYVLDETNIEGIYTVLRYVSNDSQRFEMFEMDLPEGAGVNTVLRLNGDRYVIDREATRKINDEILKSAYKILKDQNEYLKNCRIEGDLYCVTNDSGERVFLTNLKTKEEFEEVDFPKGLFECTTLGTVVRFDNDSYELVTKSTYRRGYEVKADNEFGNEKQEGTLYCVSEEEYYVGLVNLSNGQEFEAKDFTEELKSKITEGTILKYQDGEYRLEF